jgi:HNH endonuclease/NUMOD4 motif/NUMOD1 domain
METIQKLINNTDGAFLLDTSKNITDSLRDISSETGVDIKDVVDFWINFLKTTKLEIWATIEDYQDFKVSNRGRIKNFKTENYISQLIHCKYYVVTLSKPPYWKKKKCRVHKLVATYFNPNFVIVENVLVGHLDLNKFNNDASNLEWCSFKRNREVWPTKPNEIEQYEDGKLIKIWESAKTAAEALDTCEDSIRRCCRGERKTHKGFVWKDHNVVTKPKHEKVDKKESEENYASIGIIESKDEKTGEDRSWNFSCYRIRNDGEKIINMNGMVMKIDCDGEYKRIRLGENGDRNHRHNISIHKIINKVLKNGDYNNVVDHKDGNKSNNDTDNLEEVTVRENTIRAMGKPVKQINLKTGETKVFRSISEVAIALNKKYNNVRSNISRVCRGIYKTAYGYKWEWAVVV